MIFWAFRKLKINKLTSSILVCLFLSNCSSTQHYHPTPLIERPTAVDASVYDPSQYYSDASISIGDVTFPRTDGRNGERMAPLSTYQQAPFGGVLLNAEALLFIETSYREQAGICVAQRRLDLGILSANAHRDIIQLQSDYRNSLAEANILLQSRDREVNSLRENNRPNFLNYILYGSIGAAVGIAIVGILYLFTR